MFNCNISHAILNRMFEYSANLDLSLQPLLKITVQSASGVSEELSHSWAGRLFTYLSPAHTMRFSSFVGRRDDVKTKIAWCERTKDDRRLLI